MTLAQINGTRNMICPVAGSLISFLATTSGSSTSLGSAPTASVTDNSKINIAGIAGGLVGGIIVVGIVVGLVSFCLIRRRSRPSRRNENRIGGPQIQNIPASSYAAPAFASSSALRGSRPRMPHPLTQSIAMVWIEHTVVLGSLILSLLCI